MRNTTGGDEVRLLSFVLYGLTFKLKRALCPHSLAVTLAATPVRLGPFYVAPPGRSILNFYFCRSLLFLLNSSFLIDSLVSRLAPRYPSGVTVYVAHPIRSVLNCYFCFPPKSHTSVAAPRDHI